MTEWQWCHAAKSITAGFGIGQLMNYTAGTLLHLLCVRTV
jgi:hypothetical protein